MKTNSKLLISLLLVSFMTVNCGTDDPPVQPTVPVTPPPMGASLLDPPWDFEEGVYIAGSELASGDRFVAKVWGDDIPPLVYQQPSSAATSIFLSGDDLYVAGYEAIWGDCSFPPCSIYAMLWKNGVAQALTATDLDSQALSVFVSDGDVYVAGVMRSPIGYSTATVWINGVPHPLNDGKSSASATSVFVSNDDIYVAGYEEDHEGGKAKLWKNGVPETLAGGSVATSVFVAGEEVYVAGYGSSGAVVWKNGEAETLFSNSDDFYALSVYVAGEDVYVAGYGPNAIAWKNGEPMPIKDDQNAIATSISISGSDVYVVGQKNNIATVWKNGIAKSLGQGIATALFIR